MRFIPLFFLTMLAAPVSSAMPQYQGKAPVIYLVDMQTGNVLVDRQSRKRIPTASMAKMMTALVAFNALEKDRLSLKTEYRVTPKTWESWNNQGSTMFLKANEKIAVDDLLHGILTLSGNDAAIVFAEGFAGSENAFTTYMNSTAKALGMRDSHFATANGWPDGGKTYSTARDLVTLGSHIIEAHPRYFKNYFGEKSFRWGGVTQANRNPLLGVVEGADGLKTGHSDAAGYCLAGTATRNGRRLMLVIAGSPTQEARLREARALINWGFDEWQAKPYFRKGARIANVPVQLGTSTSVAVIAAHNVGATIPKDGKPPHDIAIRYKGPLKAPIKKGVQIAELVLYFSDNEKRSFPLVAGNDVPLTGFLGRARNGLSSMLGL
jgi:serine-type D-Ala-D-Ala carboxypeptidase (penicillin-binding protein 5/6)